LFHPTTKQEGERGKRAAAAADNDGDARRRDESRDSRPWTNCDAAAADDDDNEPGCVIKRQGHAPLDPPKSARVRALSLASILLSLHQRRRRRRRRRQRTAASPASQVGK
jgi:hypothetical protein